MTGPAAHPDAAALEALLSLLPPAQPCADCRSTDDDGNLILIKPELGHIDQSMGDDLDAAIFKCRLCGSVRQQPLHLGRRP